MTVNTKNRKLLIKHAAELITCAGTAPKRGVQMNDLGIISDGAIFIEEGVIARIGSTIEVCASVNEKECEIIDASGRCVLPGFIDSHTHMIFGGYRPEEFFWRLQGRPYLEILEKGGGILNTMKATRSASMQEMKESGKKRLQDMVALGITTVESKSGYGMDLDTELRQLQVMKELSEEVVELVPTFLGAHAVPPEYKGRTDEYVSYMTDMVLPAVAEQGIAEFCDVFCEQGVFSLEQSRRILAAAKKLGLKAKLHADEIISLGGAELAASVGAVSADHLLQASDQGIQDMATEGTIATILPMTAFCLREHFARARYMIDSGGSVALATDFNPGSCFSHSIPLVIALAALHLQMKPAEIVNALTINAAAAVGRQDRIGSLEVGKQADILLLDFPSHLFLVYHTGMNIVNQVIKRGQLVWNKNACMAAGRIC